MNKSITTANTESRPRPRSGSGSSSSRRRRRIRSRSRRRHNRGRSSHSASPRMNMSRIAPLPERSEFINDNHDHGKEKPPSRCLAPLQNRRPSRSPHTQKSKHVATVTITKVSGSHGDGDGDGDGSQSDLPSHKGANVASNESLSLSISSVAKINTPSLDRKALIVPSSAFVPFLKDNRVVAQHDQNTISQKVAEVKHIDMIYQQTKYDHYM